MLILFYILCLYYWNSEFFNVYRLAPSLKCLIYFFMCHFFFNLYWTQNVPLSTAATNFVKTPFIHISQQQPNIWTTCCAFQTWTLKFTDIVPESMKFVRLYTCSPALLPNIPTFNKVLMTTSKTYPIAEEMLGVFLHPPLLHSLYSQSCKSVRPS